MIRECLVICVYAQTHSTTVSFLTVANCYSELELMYQVAGFYMIYVFLSFTAVDCGNLTDPANGSVNHTAGTTFGENATYSCNTGYNLVGNSTSTCQAIGNWSGSAPACQGVYIQKLITGDVTWCCLTLTTCYQLIQSVFMMDFSTGCHAHGRCFGWLPFMALA